MMSLRCRLLQYTVFVGINGWHGNNIFCRYFLFHVMASRRRRNSSIARGKRLQKHMQKEHTKSLNKCFVNICWKRGLQNQQKRNCSSYLFFRYHAYFLRLQCIKQLSDSVFVICGIINVSVRVICLAFGSADNSYLDIDNSAYHKNLIQ